jgi:hypothetical protein
VPAFEPSPFEGECGRHIAIFYPQQGVPGLKGRLQQQGAQLVAPWRETSVERFCFLSPDGYMFEASAGGKPP